MPEHNLHGFDLTTRGLALGQRADSLNIEERTFEAVVSTDTPTEVLDWQRWEIVEEVLLQETIEWPDKLPLLRAHRRWDVEDVLGSLTSMRANDGKTVAKVSMLRNDETADKAWERVSQGHLTDVSIGYRVNKFITIEPGQTATVEGREFTASEARALRVVTDWTPKEVSLVPIGADEFAKIRQERGIAAPGSRNQPNDSKEHVMHKPTNDPLKDEVRSDPATPAPTGQDDAPKGSPVDVDAIRRAAAEGERRRVADVTTALRASGMDQSFIDKCINDGVNVEQAKVRALDEITSSRSNPIGDNAPGVIVRKSIEDLGVAEGAAAMAMRCGLDPSSDNFRMALERQAEEMSLLHGDNRLVEALGERDTQQIANEAGRFRRMGMFELAQACIRMDGGTVPSGTEAVYQRAFSGGSFAALLTSNAEAAMMVQYDEVGDTTAPFTYRNYDVPDFKSNERARTKAGENLRLLHEGEEPQHTKLEAEAESYKLKRFAAQFTADERYFINDRFDEVIRQLGRFSVSAGRLVPDLVYSLLLENPVMRDVKALFHTGHGNLNTSHALTQDNLQSSITAMMTQKEGDANLNIRPEFLITTAAQRFLAKGLLMSDTVQSPATAVNAPTLNTLRDEEITPITDGRLDNGVVDPLSGETRNGVEGIWLLVAGRGQSNIEVGFLRGTGGRPRMRSEVLGVGRGFGMVFDINHDVSAAVLDWRGIQKNTA